MIKIAPSILAADISCLAEQVSMVEEAGAELLHIDIMDGHFVPNLTFGPLVVSSIRDKSNLIFDVHLMISEPLKYIEPFARAGADIITVHVEVDDDLDECISKIHSLGKKAGIVFNPNTQIENYIKYFDKIEMVLIMSVYPGFGGQKFIPEVLDKVREIRSITGHNFDIEIDGGITLENIHMVIEAGANVIVAGSSVFGATHPMQAIEKLKS